MNKLSLILVAIFFSLKASALSLDCTPKEVSIPWNEIVSIMSEIQFPTLKEHSPNEVTIVILKEFDNYEFESAEFVVDNDNTGWGSRFKIPLKLQEENGKLIALISLPSMEMGKHGVLVTWRKTEHYCPTQRYFPIDA